MTKRIRGIAAAQRRRRTLSKIRREFERYGYRLDDVSDSKIETALTRGERDLNETSLSAKSIYLALRRLSMVDHNRHMRKNSQIV